MCLRRLIILLSLVLLSFSCSKEDVDLRDVNINQLDKSFVILGDRTIEINVDELDQTIISKSASELVVRNLPIFDRLQIGDQLTTSLLVDRQEDLIFREVVDFQRIGDQIRIQTTGTNHMKVYDRFHLDITDQDFISFRSGDLCDLSTYVEDVNNSLESVFGTVLMLLGSPINVTPELEIKGNIEFTMTDPNTVWRGLFCNPDCFRDPKNTMDIDGDGVYDVVEEWWNSIKDPSQEYDYFYELAVNNFQLEQLKITFKKFDATLDFDAAKDPLMIEEALSQTTSADYEREPEPLNITYLSTPPIAAGVGIAVGLGPIFQLMMSAQAAARIDVNFNKVYDIKIGYLNYTSVTNFDFAFDVTVLQKGKKTSIDPIPESTNLLAGFTGRFESRLGVALAAGVTLGEVNSAGAAIGCLLEIGPYAKVEGNLFGGFEIATPIPNSISPIISGEFCFDFGFGIESFAFVDFNIFNGVGDVLDTKIPFSSAATSISFFELVNLSSPSNSDFMYGDYQPGKGLCLGPPGCSGVSIIEPFASTQTTGSTITLNFSTSSDAGGFYDAFIRAGTQKFLFGTFPLNQDIQGLVLEVPLIYRQALVAGSLELLASDKAADPECITAAMIVTELPCEVTEISVDPSYTQRPIIDKRGFVYQYLTHTESIALCASLGKRLPTSSDYNPNGKDCISGTGYLINDKVTNTENLYYWLASDDVNNPFSIVEWSIREVGLTKIFDFKQEITNQSTLAPCICVD